MTGPLSPPEILRRTADWIAEDPTRFGRKWLYNAANRSRDALGAIAYTVIGDRPVTTYYQDDPFQASDVSAEAARLLYRYLVDELGVTRVFVMEGEGTEPDPVMTVGEWSDRATLHEVIGTLRSAAAWGERLAGAA